MARKVDLNRKTDSSNFRANKNTRPFFVNENVEDNIPDDEMYPEENMYDDENEIIENNEPESGNFRSISGIRNSISNVINRRRNNASGVANTINNVKEETKEEVKSATIKMAMKNPVVRKVILIAIPIVLFLLLIVFMIAAISDELSGGSNYYGLGGYPYYSGACSQISLPDGSIIGIEEYVAGVVSREVTGFGDDVLKAIAIAARTYVIASNRAPKVGDDPATCYYDVQSLSDNFQVYSPTTAEKYINAANETRGLIITLDGNITGGHFDASCVYTADQALELDPTGGYTNDNYYIKYGEWDVGGINFQPIPTEMVSQTHGSLGTYVNAAVNGTPCYGNHGGGISQNGSGYLEDFLGYDWKQIIDYYYNGESELMSIYRGLSYTGNYPIDPDDELYKNVEYFRYGIAFGDFLEQKGTNMDEFNSNLTASIEQAGVGTREGSVAAAVTLVGSLAEMGIKLGYDWGGNYYNLGANRHWGEVYDNSHICSSYPYMTGPDYCMSNYKWRGFDCAGFVNWAVRNGMQDTSISRLYTSMPGISLDPNYPVCEPGGVLVNGGHIVLVIGIDEATNRYIIAESTGGAGLRIRYMDYAEGGYRCNNLNELYGD